MPTEEYRKLVNERIGRAVREGSRSQFEDNADLKGAREDEGFVLWLKKAKRNQIQRRRRRMASVAAVFLCLFLGAGLLYHLPADDQAFARHGQSDHAEEQGGSIVIGGDGNGNVGTWTATFTSYEDIPEQYKEEIVWFEELPEGYELKEIKLQKTLDSLTVRIYFCKEEKEIIIKEIASNKNAAEAFLSNNYLYYGEYADIDVYYKEVEDYIGYSFFKNNMLISIDGTKSDNEKGGSTCLLSMINTIS